MDFEKTEKVLESIRKRPIHTVLILMVLAILVVAGMYLSGYIGKIGQNHAAKDPTCSISGLVFDSDSNEPLAGVRIALYRHIEHGRPRQIDRNAATTGLDGTFTVARQDIERSEFPLIIALWNPNWVATRITNERIEYGEERIDVNIPIAMSEVEIKHPAQQDLSVRFTVRREDQNRYVTGTVKNKTNSSFRASFWSLI